MSDDESFESMLARCIPAGQTEEQWAIQHGIALRTLRRAKRRSVRFQKGTVEKMARAMTAIGGRLPQRIERIAAATVPPDQMATTEG